MLSGLRELSPKGGVVVAVEGVTDPEDRFGRPWKGCIRVAFKDDEVGWRRIFAACSQLAGDRLVSLGRRYPVLRSAASEQVIRRTAGQNALIGLVFFLPGADMPAMVLNQVKMLLYLAGIYGGEIGVDRALELAGILAMGFGFRGLARRIVSQIPGFGWIYKAIVGYLGTFAVGMAAVRYFESDAPASTRKVIDLAKHLRR